MPMNIFSKTKPEPEPEKPKADPMLDGFNEVEKEQLFRIISELLSVTKSRKYYWRLRQSDDTTYPCFDTMVGEWTFSIQDHISYYDVTVGDRLSQKTLLHCTVHDNRYDSNNTDYRLCRDLWMAILRQPVMLIAEVNKMIHSIRNEEDEGDEVGQES